MKLLRLIGTFVLVLISIVAGTSCGHGEGNQSSTSKDLMSQQVRLPGEYLVTLSAGGEAGVITNLYGRFGIKEMKNIGNNVFLVTLSDDPGLARMEELRAQEHRIKAIQPNLAYRSQPKLEPGAEY
jgi:hypothetical protein